MIFRRIHYPTFNLRSTFEELERMRTEMDRLFGQATGRVLSRTAAGVFPLINLTEDKENFYVRAELPGERMTLTAMIFTTDGLAFLINSAKNPGYPLSPTFAWTTF
jgi:hypothetical protein